MPGFDSRISRTTREFIANLRWHNTSTSWDGFSTRRPRQCLQGFQPSLSPLTKKLFLLVVTVFLLAIVVLLWPILGRLTWQSDQTWYDLGWHGIAPVRHYRSFDLPVAHIEFLRQDSRCSQQQIFLAPRGPMVENPGGIILDPDGELVWRQPSLGGDTQDLRPQKYRDEDRLTFWSGHVDDGRKKGGWYMLDEAYKVRQEIYPSGDYIYGDMHEFVITSDNTAIVTLYHPIKADLSAIGGSSDGWLLENIFQEINLETREVLFEWNATSHFPLDATSKSFHGCRSDPTFAYGGCGDHYDSPFDYYHMNSIDKDDMGNYLVSGRNIHTLSYVDGKTGDVIWNLGGIFNDFEDQSAGAATNFSWQHDARWLYNGTSISLFDNSNRHYQDPDKESRGMIIDVAVSARTASLRQSYYHPQRLRSFSQGGVQIFDDGNVFVGWGHTPAFTEFSADGEVLCDARFGASAFFDFAPVTSYRVFRGNWLGRPHQPPDAIIEGATMYVSWNGATEVEKWQVEGATTEDGEFEVVAQAFRSGFETKLPLPSDDQYKFLRAVALDKNDEVLGSSQALVGDVSTPWFTPLLLSATALLACVMGALALASLSVVACLRWRRRRQRWLHGYTLTRSWDSDESWNMEGLPMEQMISSQQHENHVEQ